jgi:hypothetical protein
VYPFVIFLSAIVLSFLFRFSASDLPFDIFKLSYRNILFMMTITSEDLYIGSK